MPQEHEADQMHLSPQADRWIAVASLMRKIMTLCSNTSAEIRL